MSWLPGAPHLIVLLRRIEKGEDPLQDAAELFWLFCMKSLSPDEFRGRVLFWIDKHLEDSPKGGGFIDPDVRDIILQELESVTKIIVDRLDALCEMKRVPYIPDEVGDPESLYVSTLLESSRLIRLLKTEGYSEKTREVLAHALNALARFSEPEVSYQNPLWQKEYSTFVQAVGTFHCFEALKKGERILNPKNIASICGLLAIGVSNKGKNDRQGLSVAEQSLGLLPQITKEAFVQLKLKMCSIFEISSG